MKKNDIYYIIKKGGDIMRKKVVLIYLLREVAQVNSNLISLIRPFLATIIYFGLLISNNVGKRKKIWSFLYLFIFSLYCVLHLINVKNNFFE